MKIARLVIVAARLRCPECLEIVTHSNGTQTFTSANAMKWRQIRSVTCGKCGKAFRIPAYPFEEEVRQ